MCSSVTLTVGGSIVPFCLTQWTWSFTCGCNYTQEVNVHDDLCASLCILAVQLARQIATHTHTRANTQTQRYVTAEVSHNPCTPLLRHRRDGGGAQLLRSQLQIAVYICSWSTMNLPCNHFLQGGRCCLSTGNARKRGGGGRVGALIVSLHRFPQNACLDFGEKYFSTCRDDTWLRATCPIIEPHLVQDKRSSLVPYFQPS